MVSAADFAKSRGEADSADFLLAYADWLVVHLEEWMVTTCGELVDGLPRHYIRINPTDAQTPDPHTDLGSGPQVTDADVAVTWSYQGKRRMMLTYPILNRSQCIPWLA